MAILNNSNAISTAGGYDINNSLRFRSSASAYLNRTPASAGNRKTWTWSAWVKRGLFSDQKLFSGGTGTTDATLTQLFFNSTDNLQISGYTTDFLKTSAVYRDPSAWYHIVLSMDTTNATADDRLRLYINGTQITAFATRNNLTLNNDYGVNNNQAHNIGRYTGGSNYFDGYMTDINFIDGQALAPSSFGETDTTTGSWKPKAYTSTYGTNGFYLKFSDIATTSGSNAGLGKDFSGNANYWTTNNISVTAGTTYDAMIDSPTLTSATVANYAVLNPLSKGTNASITNANLAVSYGSAAWTSAFGTIGVSSGKWYWEITLTSAGTDVGVGISTNPAGSANSYIGGDINSWGYYGSNGNKWNNNSQTAYGATYANGDVIGVALDLDAGTLVFYKNNTSQGTAFSSLASNTYFPALSVNNSSFAANFGQRPFSYTPPTGFVRLNTYNLPDSTIKKGNSYFDAVTYNGSNSNLTVTNAGSFQPDLVWAKSRSGAYNNILVDAIRGGNLFLSSNTTSADTTSSGLATFTSSGITWIGGASGVNASGDTYVDWMWKGGNGTSSNTSGSITSTVSVNATAGFSVVTYTGNGTNGATVGHGLGVTPAMIIIKERNAVNDWLIWHQSNGTQIMFFTTAARSTNAGAFNNTLPTSSLITLGTWDISNGSSNTYVAYCFAEIAGFSKFGSFTGNSSTDGPFIYCGFRPKWILFKNTANYDWHVFDSSRSSYNLTQAFLKPNLSNAEASNTDVSIDLLSNGFKLRGTDLAINGPSANIIYAAFAENPFKNSLAR